MGYEAVMGIIRRQVQSEVNWELISSLEQIGLDEISLKKGHFEDKVFEKKLYPRKDFVTIVSAYLEGKVQLLAVLKDRKKETVKQFLKSIPDPLKNTVKSVCSDIYDGFINAAKETFGKHTKIVIDRFHIAKLYRKGLDTLRKQEMKRLKEELSEEEYNKLKGVMWTLRKSKHNVNQEDKKLLKQLFKYSEALEIAYKLQNNLTNIFDTQTSRNGGKRRLNNWIIQVKDSTFEDKVF